MTWYWQLKDLQLQIWQATTAKHISKIILTVIVTTEIKAIVTVIVVISIVPIALIAMQSIALIAILKSGYKQTVTVLAHIIAT